MEAYKKVCSDKTGLSLVILIPAHNIISSKSSGFERKQKKQLVHQYRKSNLISEYKTIACTDDIHILLILLYLNILKGFLAWRILNQYALWRSLACWYIWCLAPSGQEIWCSAWALTGTWNLRNPHSEGVVGTKQSPASRMLFSRRAIRQVLYTQTPAVNARIFLFLWWVCGFPRFPKITLWNLLS